MKHRAALKRDGTAILWGLNDQGQLDVPDELIAGGRGISDASPRILLREGPDGALTITPHARNPFIPDGKSEELKSLVREFLRDTRPVRGSLQISGAAYPNTWEDRIKEAVELKRRGEFLASAEVYVDLSRQSGIVYEGVLSALYKTVASAGDLVGGMSVLANAARGHTGNNDSVNDHQTRLTNSWRSKVELENYLRDLSGNASYRFPRDYSTMAAEVSDYHAGIAKAVDTAAPLVLSLDCKPRFLAKPAAPGEAPRVMLGPNDQRSLQDKLPSDRNEAGILFSCKFQRYQLDQNPRDGAARHSIATDMTSLAALYISTGRHQEAFQALVEADDWFQQIPVWHPPSGKYDMVGRAVVAYNAILVIQAIGDVDRVQDFLEKSYALLDQVPEASRDDDHEFVRAVLDSLSS
jgi:hypothetical protein